jgi:hypothetical protein
VAIWSGDEFRPHFQKGVGFFIQNFEEICKFNNGTKGGDVDKKFWDQVGGGNQKIRFKEG